MQRRFLFAALAAISAGAADPASAELEKKFSTEVKPFLVSYCVACHGEKNPAAQLNLRQYAAIEDVVKDHARWALVAEKLHSGEMPPKGLKQPSDLERAQLVTWVETFRRQEAAKNAGDPGLVLTRRLSNAEYNNAIRDLTGVDLRPAKEFPVDPSNAAGFDNSGESLAMSPALLSKYLQAAREVSTHLVLGMKGLSFAPHPMLAESDREKYTIQAIVNFYARQPTDYADYFYAAWRFKHRAMFQKDSATLDDFAREAKVSAKYLPMVWEILETVKEDAGPVAKLQTMWRMLPPPTAANAAKPNLLVREACVKMRDYVVKIRKLTAMQFRSPKVLGLGGTSQPLMNWKLRAYAANRRNFDRTALQVEGEPPLEIIEMPRAMGVPREDDVAVRNAAIAVRARIGDPDLLVPAGQRERYEASFARFANVFPDAFYIKERGRFYPDDSEDQGRLLSAGFHNVMGYFRDDTPLQELILDEAGKEELERLWLEFDTIGDQTTRTYVQFFFNQSGEIDGRGRESGSFRPGDAAVTSEKVIFSIRDSYLAKAEKGNSDEVAKQAIRDHFARVNATIRHVEKSRLEAEPIHLASLLDFAARAYRRPLEDKEKDDLRAYYKELREKSALAHDEAMRELVALVLMAPDFCYRVEAAEKPAAPLVSSSKRSKKLRTVPVLAEKVKPLGAFALASRLSFLLWSSLPDDELRAAAASGKLDTDEGLRSEIARMIKDPRAKALAVEFAGNWLDFRRFEDHNSVDRTRFPEFTNELRAAMFEEPIRYLDDIIRNDKPVLDVLYGKHTFVNRVLARHYGIEGMRIGREEWVRVDFARQFGRGGVLPMAAFLTRNSPGLRTSPVKRGYWVAKTLLGEAIPPPPPSVPELPDDEAKMDLPLRQMLAKHRENPSCAGCHARFDGFGLAFEGYGPVGEQRKKDLAGRPVDSKADFPGGKQGDGVDSLVEYIRGHREKDFINNLCRKFLAYSLGRSLELSDEPLLDDMRAKLGSRGNRFSALIESVVLSPQFRKQRNPHLLVAAKGNLR
jgi:mono/diheme cytochrome c family protein